MSDTIKSVIPSAPLYTPTDEQTTMIKKELPATIRVERVNKTQFADAGANFTHVCCPFCHADLMGWWADAMNAAYVKHAGFAQLDVVTPCCDKSTSLNDLTYHFDQGFYRTRIILTPGNNEADDDVTMLHQLKRITGLPWRIIVARY